MSLSRIVTFGTSFGGSFFLVLFKQSQQMNFLWLGVVVLVVGLLTLDRLSKQYKAAKI